MLGNRADDLTVRNRKLAHHREAEARESGLDDHLHENPGWVADDRRAAAQLLGMEERARRLASVRNAHVSASQPAVEQERTRRHFRVVCDRAGGILGPG